MALIITLDQILLALPIAVGAGFLGSLLGLGGGVFLVPALIYLVQIDPKIAIGASIVAVIATSNAAAGSYVQQGLTNLRMGMFLEVSTTLGAITGAVIATETSSNALKAVFGFVLIYASATVYRKRRSESLLVTSEGDKMSRALHFKAEYKDEATRKEVSYNLKHSPIMTAIAYVAGIASGLLGIGGGVVKVPAMTALGRIPIKAAVATSNFMIGVTAAASAVVYFERQLVDPAVVAPVAIGVLIGASIGARATNKIQAVTLRRIFAGVLVIAAVKLVLDGLGVSVP